MQVKLCKKLCRFLSICLLSIAMVISCSLITFAVDTQTNSEIAKNALTTGVQAELQNNSYSTNGGGSYSGSDLFDSVSDGYDLNESKFNELTSSAQTQLVSDIADASYKVKEEDTSGDITDDTINNWWKQLQTKKGAGSKFLNVILENTKPDFVTANQIYSPFSGIVGTVMGLIAVLGMGLLGIVLVADIFYIVLPPVQLLVPDEAQGTGRGGRRGVSKIFSDDAIYAVRVAQDSEDGGGNKKQALGVYFKRRVVMLIILGICLLYLVSGSIYTLVGMILDLVSGFIGF